MRFQPAQAVARVARGAGRALAFTGLSSSALAFFATFSETAFWVVLGAVTAGIAWFGWLAGAADRLETGE